MTAVAAAHAALLSCGMCGRARDMRRAGGQVAAAQAALQLRARANSEATRGVYGGGVGGAAGAASLHVAGYTY